MEAFEAWLAAAQDRRRVTGRPLVTLSFAQSLDGSITAVRGRPTGISGPAAMKMTHRLRALHQCILVGLGTVLADNPRLTVRLLEGKNPQPVIMDSGLHTPPSAYLVSEHPNPAWLAAVPPHDPGRRKSLEQAGGRILSIAADQQGRVDLARLLDCLAELGVDSLLVEGGAEVITSFLTQGLVDQVVLTIAPVFLGGVKALAEGVLSPEGGVFGEAPLRLTDTGYTRMGEDLVLWGKIASPGA